MDGFGWHSGLGIVPASQGPLESTGVLMGYVREGKDDIQCTYIVYATWELTV